MASQVEICNLALSWLGANSITSIDDNTVEAERCKQNYDLARRSVLEERNWTFGVTPRELSPKVGDPPGGFNYAFQIPGDSLRLIVVTDLNYDKNGDGKNIIWQKFGNDIVTNNSKIFIRYMLDVKSEALFSSTFVQAFAARMAADLAIPITKSKDMMKAMWSLYESKLSIAAARDGTQGTSEVYVSTQLRDVRRNGAIM